MLTDRVEKAELWDRMVEASAEIAQHRHDRAEVKAELRRLDKLIAEAEKLRDRLFDVPSELHPLFDAAANAKTTGEEKTAPAMSYPEMESQFRTATEVDGMQDSSLFRVYHESQPTGGYLVRGVSAEAVEEWTARNHPGDAGCRVESWTKTFAGGRPYNALFDSTKGDLEKSATSTRPTTKSKRPRKAKGGKPAPAEIGAAS